MRGRLPTIIPPSKTVTLHRPNTIVTLTGTLFRGAKSASWRPKPAAGNHLLTGVTGGVDCILKVYGGVGDSGSPSSLQTMLRAEVEALTKLRNCYAVVNLLHADGQALWSGTKGGRHSVVLTETCHLGNVSMLVPSRGGLPVVFARSLFDQLLFALEFCHMHRIAHTDICLENMLLHGSGELRLSGFSRAKFGGGARRLERSHILDRERGRRSATSTIGRYTWPPELRLEQGMTLDSSGAEDSDSSASDSDEDDEILLELREKIRKKHGRAPIHDVTKYDAYAGDVWSAAVCLLVMCTGRAPFVSLALPPTPEQIEAEDTKTIDWALNAWCEGEMGRRRFWEMLVSLQPNLLREMSFGFDELLVGMMHVDSWQRIRAKDAHAHRWTRLSGNHAKPDTIRSYVTNVIHPTLHGVSGHDGSVEPVQSTEMIRAAAEFSTLMIGNKDDDANPNPATEEKGKDQVQERGERKKILGNSGLSFYQANAYAVRNAKRTAVEKIKRMNQTGKKKLAHETDASERSALAQLGVQRAKQLAAEGNDAIYPHLETMWSKALGKQIMVRMPPLPKSEQEMLNNRRDKTLDLKALEQQLMASSKEVINIYLRDHQTVLDVKKIMASRVVEEHPERWFDYSIHTLCLCGKPLPDEMIVGSSTMFNRGNTVFRLFRTDSIPTNENHNAARARVTEGRGYVQLFDYFEKCRPFGGDTELNNTLYGDDDDTAISTQDKLRHGSVDRALIIRALVTGKLPFKRRMTQDKEAEDALTLLSSRLNYYKIQHELSTTYLSDQWLERVTGPEFIRLGLRLREEVIAHHIFVAMQQSGVEKGGTEGQLLARQRKKHTRMTKGSVITALTENIKVRRVMSHYPEMDALHKARRDDVAEAIRTMKTGAGSQLIGELDLLHLMRRYGAPEKEEEQVDKQKEEDSTDAEKEVENSSIHYLSWKNALETKDYAWRFTGQHSKAAEAKRLEQAELAARREKRRLEQQARTMAKKQTAEKKRLRKEQIVHTLKARYGVLSDYFTEFGLAPARMDYRKFMQHCVQTFRDMLVTNEKVGKHWGEGALTGEYIVKYNTQNYRNLQGLKAQETHLRRADIKKSGLLTLVEFMGALKSMEWVYNGKSAEEAFTPFVVDDIF
jgi:serine/threonine protein kinase